MYIITREENEYDQMGEYFVAAFDNKPTEKQLFDLLASSVNYSKRYHKKSYESLAKHLVKGGGRKGVNDTWYKLHEITPGKLFYTE